MLLDFFKFKKQGCQLPKLENLKMMQGSLGAAHRASRAKPWPGVQLL